MITNSIEKQKSNTIAKPYLTIARKSLKTSSESLNVESSNKLTHQKERKGDQKLVYHMLVD